MAPTALNGHLERDDVQGLLASGFGHLPETRFLLVEIVRAPSAAAWLGRLVDDVTTATTKTTDTALNIAVSPSALSTLGLPARTVARFSDRFVEGMTAPFRSRALGDVAADAPQHWSWGGPDTRPVDVVVLLYARTRALLDALERRVAGRPARDGIALQQRLDAELGEREHFGFRDGIAQPAVMGLRQGPPADTVQTGEFVLGYPNEYGLVAPGPMVEPAADRGGILPSDLAGSGGHDLGRNGSYLVFRHLDQDVTAFWRFVDQAARHAAGPGDRAARVRLAAKMVGRWPDGQPLVLAPDAPEQAAGDADDFGYFHTDPHGTRCPLGSHIRRSHPRDSLDPGPGSPRSVAVDKRHRLLRRGRRYGPPITPERALAANGADTEERGIFFIGLCANIARQFEFIQHSWIGNPKFNGLHDDADPLLGLPGRTFTIQAEPVRTRVVELPSFVRVRGGGYFFLPGVRALRYLADLAARSG